MATSSDSSASPPPKPPSQPEGEMPFPPIGKAWYLVAVLLICYVFSFADRQLLTLMVDDIKEGLNIESDFQVGILMGPAFAVFYCIFGFPLGRLADTINRRWLIGIGLSAWSLMAAGCGVARNFWQFMGFRIGVGVGEASLSPAAYSLIADSFPKNKMATAISVYSSGIYIGVGGSLLLGSWAISKFSEGGPREFPIVGTLAPWQMVFVLIGLLGFIAVPLLFTVPEPQRRGLKAMAGGKIPSVPVREVAAYIRKNGRTVLCHNVGFALLSFSSYGSGAWIPAYFQRVHGWSKSQSGYVYGTIVLVMGTLGIAAGGRIADWMARKGIRNSKMRMGLIAAVVWFPFGMAYPLIPSAWLSAAFLVPAVFTATLPFGVAPAAIQEMMPNNMRGQASALYLFVVNMIGMAFGPMIVAQISDMIGREKIHLSLFWVSTAAHSLSAVFLWFGLKPFLKSMDNLEEWNKSEAA